MTKETGGRNSRKGFLPSDIGPKFWLKVLAIGITDAAILFALPILFAEESWFLFGALLLSGFLINWAYLSPKAVASKWLAPGIILMAVFVVFPVVYTAYVSVTNWATGNILTQEQAVEQLESIVVRTEGEGSNLDLAIYRDGAGQLALLVTTPDGVSYFGVPRDRGDDPNEDPLLDNGGALATDPPETIGGFELLTTRDLFTILNSLENLVLDIPDVGVAQVESASLGLLIQSGRRYTFDEGNGTLFDSQENVSCNIDVGNFVCDDGRRLDPGWVTTIGMQNYKDIFSNERIRGPVTKVFIWNIVFAVGSVFLTFAVGLLLANALLDDRLKGRAFYRSMFILPYAIPAFLSVLVWRGLLNFQFGQVNRLLESMGMGSINWLGDPVWAKVAILLVNTWLGFPYMFLLMSGALTSVPEELKEAARVDGASAARVFRTVTLPLLLVSTAPLLIGSFAFNFNNFILIFMLTNGGPPVVNSAVPYGETDILLSFVFDLAVNAGRGNNFALGSAIVVIIFFLVAGISAFSFRFTKRLEEIYGDV